MSVFANVTRVIQDLFTEADNTVVDLKRVAAAAGISTFCFATVHAVAINHQAVDFQSMGLGVAAVVASVGGSLALGSKAESKPDIKPDA